MTKTTKLLEPVDALLVHGHARRRDGEVMTAGNEDVSREESMLRQVAANVYGDRKFFWELIRVDDSLPSDVVHQIADPADAVAALECWRLMMVAVVNNIAETYKGVATGTIQPS